MRIPAKPLVISVVTAVTFSIGAAPALAAPATTDYTQAVATQLPESSLSQSLDTGDSAAIADPIDPVVALSETDVPHGFDVEAAIEQAESEIGTSRATGWSQPGECIMSAKRWINAGGGDWTGGGDPVSNYDNATRVSIADAEPGDIVQYENIASPTSWISGVHTVMITEVHEDGTFTIIESNNPGGSGLVSEDTSWTPKPPEGFQAAVWRF